MVRTAAWFDAVGHHLEELRVGLVLCLTAGQGRRRRKSVLDDRSHAFGVGPMARLAKSGEDKLAAFDGRAIGSRKRVGVGRAAASPRGIVPGTGARSVIPSLKFGFSSNALYLAVRAMLGKYSKLGRAWVAKCGNVQADRHHQRHSQCTIERAAIHRRFPVGDVAFFDATG